MALQAVCWLFLTATGHFSPQCSEPTVPALNIVRCPCLTPLPAIHTHAQVHADQPNPNAKQQPAPAQQHAGAATTQQAKARKHGPTTWNQQKAKRVKNKDKKRAVQRKQGSKTKKQLRNKRNKDRKKMKKRAAQHAECKADRKAV